jgi:non-ribosomal peptide synthetase component E (peptide arylation enzyme)
VTDPGEGRGEAGRQLSALEIENVMLEHPDLAEVAVCGVADDAYGQAVAAVVVWVEGRALTDRQLREWCRERMALYKVPPPPLPWLLCPSLHLTLSEPVGACGRVSE